MIIQRGRNASDNRTDSTGGEYGDDIQRGSKNASDNWSDSTSGEYGNDIQRGSRNASDNRTDSTSEDGMIIQRSKNASDNQTDSTGGEYGDDIQRGSKNASDNWSDSTSGEYGNDIQRGSRNASDNRTDSTSEDGMIIQRGSKNASDNRTDSTGGEYGDDIQRGSRNASDDETDSTGGEDGMIIQRSRNASVNGTDFTGGESSDDTQRGSRNASDGETDSTGGEYGNDNDIQRSRNAFDNRTDFTGGEDGMIIQRSRNASDNGTDSTGGEYGDDIQRGSWNASDNRTDSTSGEDGIIIQRSRNASDSGTDSTGGEYGDDIQRGSRNASDDETDSTGGEYGYDIQRGSRNASDNLTDSTGGEDGMIIQRSRNASDNRTDSTGAEYGDDIQIGSRNASDNRTDSTSGEDGMIIQRSRNASDDGTDSTGGEYGVDIQRGSRNASDDETDSTGGAYGNDIQRGSRNASGNRTDSTGGEDGMIIKRGSRNASDNRTDSTSGEDGMIIERSRNASDNGTDSTGEDGTTLLSWDGLSSTCMSLLLNLSNGGKDDDSEVGEAAEVPNVITRGGSTNVSDNETDSTLGEDVNVIQRGSRNASDNEIDSTFGKNGYVVQRGSRNASDNETHSTFGDDGNGQSTFMTPLLSEERNVSVITERQENSPKITIPPLPGKRNILKPSYTVNLESNKADLFICGEESSDSEYEHGAESDDSDFVPPSEYCSSSEFEVTISPKKEKTRRAMSISPTSDCSRKNLEKISEEIIGSSKQQYRENREENNSDHVSQSIVPETCEPQVTSTSPSDSKTSEGPYKKPYRFCIFCKGLFSKLRNHQEKKHKTNSRVSGAMQMGRKDRNEAFENFRKEGILEYNKMQTKKNPDNPELQRERQRPEECQQSVLVMCTVCYAFIEKKYKKKHEKVHFEKTDTALKVDTIPASLLGCSDYGETDKDSGYVKEILSRFRTDDAGSLCVKDQTLLHIGRILWHKVKSKVDKKVEVRRTVMSDMRRLASLYIFMQDTESVLGDLPSKEGNINDMFKRANFKHLQEAVEKYTYSDSNGNLKSGLKNALYYVLRSTSRILKGIHLINECDEKATEIERFVTVLEMHKDLLFGDATYAINKRSQEKLRRPQGHPNEEDIQKLKKHTLRRIAELTENLSTFSDVTKNMFIELRDLVVCRLTLFNARRGGEPSRLFVNEWVEAEQGAWLDEKHLNKLDPIDKALAQTLKVGYQTGKGKHLVPVLFPKDTHEALRLLASKNLRAKLQIGVDSKYLFPSSCSSEHVSGWHAVQSICSKLDLKDSKSITATRNRHRVSTEFAMMDIAPAEREYIYRHLGHSEEINRHVYQAPLAVREITLVGRRLQTIDEDDTEVNECDETAINELYPLDFSGSGNQGTNRSETNQSTPNQIPDTNRSTPTSTGIFGKENKVPNFIGYPLDFSGSGNQGTNQSTPSQTPDTNHSTPTCTGIFDKENKVPNFKGNNNNGRSYTHWDNASENLVFEYFDGYLTGKERKKLPGRKDIEMFLKKYPDCRITDWVVIRSKVNNQKTKLQKAVKKLVEGDTLIQSISQAQK